MTRWTFDFDFDSMGFRVKVKRAGHRISPAEATRWTFDSQRTGHQNRRRSGNIKIALLRWTVEPVAAAIKT